MLKNTGRKLVMLPDTFLKNHFTGKIYGKYFSESDVFNIYAEEMVSALSNASELGEIVDAPIAFKDNNVLVGWWNQDRLCFSFNGNDYRTETYTLIQNIFSRNIGILESSLMMGKTAFISGCGSVGSLVALELARSGTGRFILIDGEILEYHNICRHQCSVSDVGQYKVIALSQRIKAINPSAEVIVFPRILEQIPRKVFDNYCDDNDSIIVGAADSRLADIYANSISVSYKVPFVSIGFMERAFAGEIFYWLPHSNMPCYKCALGDAGTGKVSTNRRHYTTQEDLSKVNFEPGISVDINFVTTIGIKLIIDILNRSSSSFTPRLLGHLKQYTLVCNTNNPEIGGYEAEIFSYPLQVTTSMEVSFHGSCPPCEAE